MNHCQHHSWTRSWPRRLTWPSRRHITASAWHEKLARPVQTYISTSRNPYVNLSIEHDILLRSAKDSVILFLYTNRPSVIIGRNQNPWLEVNIPLLSYGQGRPETEPPGLGSVDLVRRRSGGGTVFHDEGNINWTVICPRDLFTRDKHAEMIVRALRNSGVDRSRVNERHDIVLDAGERIRDTDPDDTHATPYTNAAEDAPKSLKVSGSAYKITGSQRALHHGTCLLSSPNLNIIPQYLHSPAKPFIKEARGVQSVSSPVSNILLAKDKFITAVSQAFAKVYQMDAPSALEEVGDEMAEIQSVSDGVSELMSAKYKYEQTPQFVLSNASDDNSRLLLELVIREGGVSRGSFSRRDSITSTASSFEVDENHLTPKLHELDPATAQLWAERISHMLSDISREDRADIEAWLHSLSRLLH